MKKDKKEIIEEYKKQDEYEEKTAEGFCCDVCEIASCDVCSDCCCDVCTNGA